MTAQSAGCPTQDVLTAHGLGKLDAANAETVEAHLETCVDCCRVVAEVPADNFIGRLRAAHDQYATLDSGEPPAASRRSSPDESVSNASATSETPSPARSGQPSTPYPNLVCPSELANHPDFEVIKELGRGGMGIVYLAKHRTMGRFEVLKVVNKARLDGPGAMDRFLQEIRSAAGLNHPNIVAAYSVLRAGDLLVFSMEYVDGEDLAEVVKRRGPLPIVNATFYAHQVALGLQHAHERGMVHRDIKPNNLILARVKAKHVVKILDFGLAKATSEEALDGGLTYSGQMLGTPVYMSPEQWRDAQKADIRADIYSLGCTLYFFLTGKPPFTGSLAALMEAHQTTEARSVKAVRPDIPAEFAAVVAKMLAKNPADRYQTPTEVLQALGPFLNPTGQLAPQITMPPAAPAEAGHQLATIAVGGSHAPTPIVNLGSPDTVRAAPKSARRWRLPLAIGLLLFGPLGLGAIYLNLKTADGTVVVRVDVPNPKILVDGEDNISVTWADGGKTATIRVRPGTRKIELKKDGFAAIGEAVEVEAGGHSVLSAHFVPDQPSSVASVVPQVRPPPLAAAEVSRPASPPPPSGQPSPAKSQATSGAKSGSAGNGPPSSVANVVPQAKPPLRATGEVSRPASAPTPTPQPAPADSKSSPPAMGGSPSSAPPLAIAPFDTAQAKAHQAAWASHLGVPVERTHSIGMKLVLIPPGEFMMGSPASEEGRNVDEGPQHRVRITRPFSLATTEVTQGQWESVMRTTPWKGWNNVQEGPDYAATFVSWDDAVKFCQELSGRDGRIYRLPTEAEWEYACRAGTTDRYSFGPDESRLGDCGWYGGLKGDDGNAKQEQYAHRVGVKRANNFGLYDMHGNVLEWCSDWYDSDYYGHSPGDDPTGSATGPLRVYRGGDWYRGPLLCRSACRDRSTPGERNSVPGFRVASSPTPTPQPTPPDSQSSPPAIGGSPGSAPPLAIAPFDTAQAKAHQAARAKHLGVPAAQTNSIGMKLVLIPPGEFMMGSPASEEGRRDHEGPQHRVRITRPFYLGTTEVTQGQWESVMRTTPWKGQRFVQEGSDYAATFVSWDDVAKFCQELSGRDGRTYRLPAEAEWEYACRAGSTDRFSFGPDESRLGDYGWYGADVRFSNAEPDQYAHRVGVKRANIFGLYDMHGNALEWCSDWYGSDYYGHSPGDDPTGSATGSLRVIRGGGWYSGPQFCRSAHRYGSTPDVRTYYLGFRVASSPGG